MGRGGRVLNRDAFIGLIVFVITIFLLVYWKGIIEAVGLESVDGGTWLQTSGTIIGAFLGAGLAGLISLKSVEKQIRLEKEEKEKARNISLRKSAVQLVINFGVIIEIFEEIVRQHDEEGKAIELDYYYFILRITDLNNIIDNINTSDFSLIVDKNIQHSKYIIKFRLTDLINIRESLINPKEKENNYLNFYSETEKHININNTISAIGRDTVRLKEHHDSLERFAQSINVTE